MGVVSEEGVFGVSGTHAWVSPYSLLPSVLGGCCMTKR